MLDPIAAPDKIESELKAAQHCQQSSHALVRALQARDEISSNGHGRLLREWPQWANNNWSDGQLSFTELFYLARLRRGKGEGLP